MTKEEEIALMLQFRADGEEGNRATFRRMSKAERFRIGKQWDHDTLERNKAQRKFSLTIDRISPTIDHLTGVEVQNPRDIRAHHTKGGTKKMAELLTALAKHVLDTSHAQRQKTQMFDDGISTARGWIGADFDYSNDPVNADIIVKKYDPFAVLPDPNRTHYDLNQPAGGAKFVIVDEWVDKKKVEAEYPKLKPKLVDASYATPDGRGVFSQIVNFIFDKGGPEGAQDDYRDHTKDSVEGLASSRAKYSYRKSTYWWKEWKLGIYIQRLDDPLNYRALTKPSDITAGRRLAEQDPDVYNLIDKDREGQSLTIGVLHKTVMVGNVLLSCKEDPFDGIHLFPVVPFNPYFKNGYEFGLVEKLIGPQEQINWSWSMELNLIKQLANTGWKIKKAIGKIKKFLEEHGSEDGIVLDESQGGGKIEKIEPNKPSIAFDIVTEKGSKHIAETSNIRLESPQTDKDRVAAAIRLKQQASFTGSAALFGNYDYTMELLGELIIALIRKTKPFSEDEIRAIVDEEQLIDRELLERGREMVTQQLRVFGEKIPEPPPQPNPTVLEQMEPPQQQQMIDEYQRKLKQVQPILAKVEQLARKYAQDMLLAQVGNLQRGRYGIKVSLAPMAETLKIVRGLETLELNKVLIESGHKPLSRRRLIEATDPANKEAILAEEGTA